MKTKSVHSAIIVYIIIMLCAACSPVKQEEYMLSIDLETSIQDANAAFTSQGAEQWIDILNAFGDSLQDIVVEVTHEENDGNVVLEQFSYSDFSQSSGENEFSAVTYSIGDSFFLNQKTGTGTYAKPVLFENYNASVVYQYNEYKVQSMDYFIKFDIDEQAVCQQYQSSLCQRITEMLGESVVNPHSEQCWYTDADAVNSPVVTARYYAPSVPEDGHTIIITYEIYN